MNGLVLSMNAAGYPYRQIAIRLGITKGAVAGIIHRHKHPTEKVERHPDLWTEARLTEKWENRKRRLAKK